MHDLISAATRRRSEVEARLGTASALTPEDFASPERRFWLCETLRWFIDFGHQAQAYEISERLGRHFPAEIPSEPSSDSLEELLASRIGFALFLRIVLAHMDMSRKKNLAAHLQLFERLAASGSAYCAAQGKSGLGLGEVFAGRLDDALKAFERARELFLEAGAPVDALKMQVRRISCLRFREEYAAADQICREILDQAAPLGIDAVSPLLCAQSLLGSNAAERGNKHEARRHLREAARLSRALPPSQAGAFAMFQYGRILSELHDRREALTWLEAAEKIQRIEDPIARTATLMTMARCYRMESQWGKAWEALQGVQGSRVSHLDPLDAEPLWNELLLVCIGLVDFDAAREIEARIEAWLAEHPDRVASFARTRASLREAEERWKSACGAALGNTSDGIDVYIDFPMGRALLKKGQRFQAGLSFRGKSSMEEALARLLSSARAGERRVTRKELLVAFGGDEAAQRKVTRVVEDLKEAGLLTDVAAGIWELPEGARIRWIEG